MKSKYRAKWIGISLKVDRMSCKVDRNEYMQNGE